MKTSQHLDGECQPRQGGEGRHREPASTAVNRMGEVAKVVQSILTSIAIIVGGFWTYTMFFKEREHVQRANLEIDASYIQIGKNVGLVHGSVLIENAGTRILEVDDFDLSISGILPLSRTTKRKLAIEEDPVVPGGLIIDWPTACRRQVKLARWIEPGEAEKQYFDFILHSGFSVARVQAFVRNMDADDDGGPEGWRAIRYFDTDGGGDVKEDQLELLVPDFGRPALCASS